MDEHFKKLFAEERDGREIPRANNQSDDDHLNGPHHADPQQLRERNRRT
jgi:hypothetical protein